MKKQLILLYLLGFIALFQQSSCRMLEDAKPRSRREGRLPLLAGRGSYAPPPPPPVECPPPPSELRTSQPPSPPPVESPPLASDLQTSRPAPSPHEGRQVDNPRPAPPSPSSGKPSRP